jgi:hypothetical protein
MLTCIEQTTVSFLDLRPRDALEQAAISCLSYTLSIARQLSPVSRSQNKQNLAVSARGSSSIAAQVSSLIRLSRPRVFSIAASERTAATRASNVNRGNPANRWKGKVQDRLQYEGY